MDGAAVVLGLTLQGSAAALVVWRLGRDWLRHIGAVFIVLAVTYHGVNEIVLWVIPDYDPYRRRLDVRTVAPFMLWVSVAILLFAITYLAVTGRRPKVPDPADVEAEKTRAARFFDWRLMLVAAVPLMAVILGGQALDPNGGVQGAGATFGLSEQYFLLATVLASFGIVVRFGSGWLLPVVTLQSIAIAAIGERFAVLFAVAMLLYALARFGIRLRRRQLVVGAGLAFALLLVVTSARASQGRLATTSGDSLRFQYLANGLSQVATPEAWRQVVADLGYRFDGNSFGAMELAALNANVPPLGVTPLQNDFLLAVPSFLNPTKKTGDVSARVEKVYAEEHLGLRQLEVIPGVYLDILPTQLGSLIGFWGPWGLLSGAVVLGLVFGLADRWLLRKVGPIRLLLGLGLLYCVLDYEGSWDVYTVSFRGILVLLIIVYTFRGFRRAFGRRRRLHVPANNVSDDTGHAKRLRDTPRQHRLVPQPERRLSAGTSPRRGSHSGPD